MSDFEQHLSTEQWALILADYEAAHKRLFSLVTDLQGLRIYVEKTHEMRRQEQMEAMRRTAAFLNYAGNPEKQFKSVQIAGTSGKGSVTLMVTSLLQQLGWKTGHHTSPYLQTPAEKLVVDGRWIRPSAFIKLIDDFWSVHQKWGKSGGEFDTLKYGEAWVSLTFMHMAREFVDWGVIETGMGGRFDPITLLPADLSIITNVGWDHEKSLGPELTDIAWHKAGVIKTGQDVVTAVSEPDLLDVVKREAAEQNATLFALGDQFHFELTESGLTVEAPFGRYQNLPLVYGAGYQVQNMAVAIAAVDVLAHRHHKQLSAEGIVQALNQMTMPGRMEVMQTEPLVIIDGAHNQPKMAALIETVQQTYPDKKLTVILGMLASKNAEQMLAVVVPAAEKLIVTRPFVPGKRPHPPESLAAEIRHMSDKPVQIAANATEALEVAMSEATADDLILTTGSLYLIGEARRYWYPTEQLLRDGEFNPSDT